MTTKKILKMTDSSAVQISVCWFFPMLLSMAHWP